jgi:hypothetical protein
MRLTPHPTPTTPTIPAGPHPAGPHAADAHQAGPRVRGCRAGIRSPRRAALLAAALATAAAVLAVLAASPALAAGGGRVLAAAASVDAVLSNLRNWLMGILAGLSTVFLTVGGVRYLMAGGDPGEVEKAKTAFKNAGWGYAGAALAPLVVTILKGIVGA